MSIFYSLTALEAFRTVQAGAEDAAHTFSYTTDLDKVTIERKPIVTR
jgi:hypothetical protein